MRSRKAQPSPPLRLRITPPSLPSRMRVPSADHQSAWLSPCTEPVRCFQVSPPSSERQIVPCFDCTTAYTRRGSLGATATPIRPSVSVGKPCPWIFAQVRPPSRERYKPSAAPPLVAIHGCRRNCQIAANTVLGAFGFQARSAAPLAGPTYSVFDQLRPPSAVTYTPRAGLSFHGSPSAPTIARRGFFGSTRIFEISAVSESPACVQCFAPSRVSHTPSPYETSLRGAASPVPTHTVLSSLGATAIAPIAPNFEAASQTGWNDEPPSLDLKTPPPAPPA